MRHAANGATTMRKTFKDDGAPIFEKAERDFDQIVAPDDQGTKAAAEEAKQGIPNGPLDEGGISLLGLIGVAGPVIVRREITRRSPPLPGDEQAREAT